MSGAGTGGAESRAAANEEEFEAAQKFASSGALGKVDNEDQLQLYAWFKQSVVGDCTTPKPSMLDFVGMAKWNAWRKVAGKSPAEARAAYLGVLDRLAPGWREKEPIAADTANAGAAAGGAGGEGGMAPRVSTFAMEEEKAHDDQTQAERLLTMAGRGELEALVTALKTSGFGKGDKLSSIVGDDNETLLHMACDRDDAAMVDALIELGADVEARDVDGLTPLGYALMNDHADLARHLVSQHGANLEARGDDGDPILSMCGPALSQSLRELAASKSK
ncbi:Acyl-CoA-binding domain-containing protein 1 [Hondaea fermentalgiana]|uniref:Acyl-CoA-binding domain-containing protein 1 n=1 Tax=Hondaea fermentalgiana TaxID=2315210 RepID=A0A2R5GLL6_9STRA|nr:Acyl-CoA-binding domain-containing protein 1 [Hondaea fermentalgiana]|eukprot:GBG31525.1 Acyl-CoA-binding domain-containing protein 1 [Hondaea fermentalgiana]